MTKEEDMEQLLNWFIEIVDKGKATSLALFHLRCLAYGVVKSGQTLDSLLTT
jgi:hypothetical protein